MGTVVGYFTPSPTVVVASAVVPSDARTYCYVSGDLARDDVSHVAAVIEVALREAITQYETRAASDVQKKGRPRYWYCVELRIKSLGALAINEWKPHVDTAWQRVLQWRKEHDVAQSWKRLEARSEAYSDIIDGAALTFDFLLYNELAKA